MPLEFTVAGFRFGHTMVRSRYDFNLNFNPVERRHHPGDAPTALHVHRALGPARDFDSLPDNWIIEWERFFGAGMNFARRFDTHLVEPLFDLRRRAVRKNRGRQDAHGWRCGICCAATCCGCRRARRSRERWARRSAGGARGGGGQRRAADHPPRPGFLERTPLWYYILAEANGPKGGGKLRTGGQHDRRRGARRAGASQRGLDPPLPLSLVADARSDRGSSTSRICCALRDGSYDHAAEVAQDERAKGQLQD